MIQINQKFLDKAKSATSAAELRELLSMAIQLEHATIPPYLFAAYSLKLGENDDIRKLIIGVAMEEMLHMAIVANLLNAIGGQVVLDDPSVMPKYPGPLPMSIGGALQVGLRKFSKDLIRDVFMKIEEPELIKNFPVLGGATQTFATIGKFYNAMIDKITELGDGIFTGDPARQVVMTSHFPAAELFPITGVNTAVKAIRIIVSEGEGTKASPMNDDGFPAHYYLFESIVHGKKLVVNSATPEGFSYSGDELKFNPAGVLDLPADATAANYPVGSIERNRVDSFNRTYSDMMRSLHVAFNGTPSEIDTAASLMTLMRTRARNLVISQLPMTFEYIP